LPFSDQIPRPFIIEAIRSLDEGQTGCFGIFRPNPFLDIIEEWIYVGRGTIGEELLRHYLGDIACIRLRRPTHFVVEDTRDAEKRETILIKELKPHCNKDASQR
jgi:hypothetical protein